MSLAAASALVAPVASLRGSALGRKLSKSTASRDSRRRAVSVVAGAPLKTVEEAKELLDRQGYKMLDIRPFKAYDREHLTKPPQCAVNCPLADGVDPSALAAKCENMGLRPGAKLLVADFDGETVQAAADALFAAGYVDVVAVEGGYNGWRRVFTTCGRRRPPQGKWISTGAGGESLKSGLTLDPNVAAAYEENWGKAPPKHGERGESLAAKATGDESSAAAEPEAAPARKHSPPGPTLSPLAMDEEINRKREEARANGHVRGTSKALSDGAEGSAWDTYYDEDNTPYYHNRETGETSWEEPNRWWSGGRWVDRK